MYENVLDDPDNSWAGLEPKKPVTALFEAMEIVEIWSGLKEHNSEGLRERVKKLVCGPLGYAEESYSNASFQARDFAYELFIGSLLSRAGYTVSFPIASDQPDVEFLAFTNTRVMVECKRPKSLGTFDDAIKKAASQLRRGFAKDSTSLGMIAISFNKIVNEKFQGLYADFEGDESNAAFRALDTSVERLTPRIVSTMRVNSRISAIVPTLSLIVSTRESDTFGIRNVLLQMSAATGFSRQAILNNEVIGRITAATKAE